MSSNSSSTEVSRWRKFASGKWRLLILPVWVLAGFFLATILGSLIFALFQAAGVHFNVSDAVLQTVFDVIVYGLAIVIVILIPNARGWIKTSLKEIGLVGLPTWWDLLLPIGGAVVYLILSSLLSAVGQLLPWYDGGSSQDTGFSLNGNYSAYLLALFCLVILAPFAEEILFRGFLFAKLRAKSKIWLSALITSAAFGLAHLSWSVGIDVFALSIVLCALRVIGGSLWAPIILHMLKNGLAFYLVFVNPMF